MAKIKVKQSVWGIWDGVRGKKAEDRLQCLRSKWYLWSMQTSNKDIPLRNLMMNGRRAINQKLGRTLGSYGGWFWFWFFILNGRDFPSLPPPSSLCLSLFSINEKVEVQRDSAICHGYIVFKQQEPSDNEGTENIKERWFSCDLFCECELSKMRHTKWWSKVPTRPMC